MKNNQYIRQGSVQERFCEYYFGWSSVVLIAIGVYFAFEEFGTSCTTTNTNNRSNEYFYTNIKKERVQIGKYEHNIKYGYEVKYPSNLESLENGCTRS